MAALTPRDVVNALQTLSDDQTEELFFQLKVPLNTLSNIEKDHKGNMRKIHYVQAWYDGDEGTSWDKIVSGLRQIGLKTVAEGLAAQHGLSVAPASVDVNQSSHQMTPPVVVPSGPLAAGELCPVATASPPTPSTDRVSQVKDDIERFDDTFSDLMLEAQSELCLRESVDPSFLTKFCDRLLCLSVAKKATHTKFFRQSEDEILDARNMRKVFAILKRYCSYRNYEILQHIVKKFCEAVLQQKMQEYCQSLERFEKATPIDIYLAAIPDEANEELANAFSKLVVRIDKPASECTLYDIRKLNEAIIQGSSLCSHSIYISSVADKCVEVVVAFPSSAVGWVLSAMTPAFMHTHLLSEVV